MASAAPQLYINIDIHENKKFRFGAAGEVGFPQPHTRRRGLDLSPLIQACGAGNLRDSFSERDPVIRVAS